MRISNIRLRDWRQFRGEQQLEFAAGDRNVTLVFGTNSAGKTALLNAFTWGFFGNTTPGLADPEDLINHDAWTEAPASSDVVASVEIMFEHEGITYIARRSVEARKTDQPRAPAVPRSTLTLDYFSEGKTERGPGNPEDAIRRILPARLQRFFFFDGERDIERLTMPEAYAEIEDAIKTVLGLEVIERAAEHLDGARKQLERALKAIASPEVERLLEAKELQEDRLAELRAARAEAQERVSGLAERKARVVNKLAALEGARVDQERRRDIERALEELEATLKTLDGGISRSIGTRGFAAFIGDAAEKCQAIVEDNRERRSVPGDLKTQFVDDLLEDGVCICGESLVEGETRYDNVAKWRDRSTPSDLDNAVSRTSARAGLVLEQRQEVFPELSDYMAQHQAAIARKRSLEEERSEIHERLKDTGTEEIRGLEETLDQIETDLESSQRHTWQAQASLEETEKAIQRLDTEIAAAKVAGNKWSVAKGRVDVAIQTRDLFQKILGEGTNRVRMRLDTLVSDVFARIAVRPYVPRLTTNFHLELREAAGSNAALVTGRSTGEAEMLGLSFVAALASYAREEHERREGGGTSDVASFRGGIYPVILDSVFGNLDVEPRREVARAFPQLAPQVGVFVSESQGAEEVISELQASVGKCYVLCVMTPDDGKPSQTIELPWGEVPLVRRAVGQALSVDIMEVEVA